MYTEEQLEDMTLNIFENLGYERLNGYKQALIDNDIAFNSNYIRFCKYESIQELDEVLEETISSLNEDLLRDRYSKIRSVTRDDVKNISKKFHLKTIYLLKSGDNNGDN